jgi:hypothetical protein
MLRAGGKAVAKNMIILVLVDLAANHCGRAAIG